MGNVPTIKQDDHAREHSPCDCVDYPLRSEQRDQPCLDASFTRTAIDLQPVVEINAIETIAPRRHLEQRIIFLTPFDIEFERRVGRLVTFTIRELAHDAQALMLDRP